MYSYQKAGENTAVPALQNRNQVIKPTKSSQSRIIQLKDVTKIYETGSGDFTALEKITLDINRGDFLGIIGKSGAGKTTLLNMIAGISEITSGEVLYFPAAGANQNSSKQPILMNTLEEDELAVWRGHNLGIVYQSFELLPQINLVTNIMLPQDFAGQFQPGISKKRALELLDIVELSRHAYKLPAHISGGQKQRVAIARAMVNDPDIIVADEPTGNLDTVTAETIFQIFEKLVAQGKTIIMVTHDNDLASRFSRKLQISDGRLIDTFTTNPVYKLQTAVPSAVSSIEEPVAATLPDETEQPVREQETDTDEQSIGVMINTNGSGSFVARDDQPAISLRDVVKTYVNAAGEFTALRGIDLNLHQGQFVSIVGKSGSGKSTLLNMLTGIDHPTSGDVIIGGKNIYKMSESQRAKWRGRNMGIVFQFFQLLPTLSLLENTMLPMDYSNVYQAGERLDRAMELLKMVGLEEHVYDLPAAVSNGQQQSAAIARSMATDPPIIVADEPTGNLDSRSADNIYRVFQELADSGKTILIVTHDPSLATRTDQTVILSDGEIIDKTIAAALPLLDHPLMLHAMRRAEKRIYSAGETIIRQDDAVTHFYMVVQGGVNIVIDRPQYPPLTVARLGPGQFFGEVELLGRKNSIATVRAIQDEPVELAMLPKDIFCDLMSQSPLTQGEIRRIAHVRQEENIAHGQRNNQ